MQYKMTFSLSQETVVSVTSPLHRLAAKEQIKMLETEEAEMLSGGKLPSWAATCDFQQCDILTSVDLDEPVQPPFKLRNSKSCSGSSLTLIEYSSD